MNAADSRTRNKVVLEPTEQKQRLVSQVLPTTVLLVLSLGLAKDRVLFSQTDALWLVVQLLGVGSVIVVINAFVNEQWKKKNIEWPIVGFASLLQSLRLLTLMLALSRMSAVRVIIVSQFSSVWVRGILMPSNKQQVLVITTALLFSFASDARFSVAGTWAVAPSYISLALEGLTSSILDHTQTVLLPTLGHSIVTGISIIGGFIVTTVLYVCGTLILGPPTASPARSYAFILLPLLAYSLLYASPSLARQLVTTPSKRDMAISHIAVIGVASLLGVLALSQPISLTDTIVAGLLCYGMTLGKDRSAAYSPYTSMANVIRGYLKSILDNPESRKIFYFLVLNMCYMLVQMLYGIWTNSLGLISDAIHMAFDCMAIGVGLIASVMARWAPNERFTYGYGRIETLSGFSNGIFLILISIFIVFEAIERLIDPPEMNTSQLLLVSTLGLCVNLFGMFAMGGHHHHGGHSHGHSHGESHSASPGGSSTQDHQHSHEGNNHEAPAIVHISNSTNTCAGDLDNHSPTSSEAALPASHSSPTDSAPSRSHPSHSHSRSHSHSLPATHSHSHSHSQTQTHSVVHKESQILMPKDSDDRKKSELFDLRSPLTPSYHFGHDQHFEEHHAHEHGPNLHDHVHTNLREHEGHSHNMRGVFLHVMADTLGSVGVIISTLLIQFYGWTGFDPIASLFIAILIAASVIPLVIDTGKVLMLDMSHRTSGIAEVVPLLHCVDGLESFSSLRIWPKDDNTVIGSVHLCISPSLAYINPGGPHTVVKGKFNSVDHVVETVDNLLRSRIAGLEELTIQIEGID